MSNARLSVDSTILVPWDCCRWLARLRHRRRCPVPIHLLRCRGLHNDRNGRPARPRRCAQTIRNDQRSRFGSRRQAHRIRQDDFRNPSRQWRRLAVVPAAVRYRPDSDRRWSMRYPWRLRGPSVILLRRIRRLSAAPIAVPRYVPSTAVRPNVPLAPCFFHDYAGLRPGGRASLLCHYEIIVRILYPHPYVNAQSERRIRYRGT